ncbi:hypothetical protein [Bibersteinia trehalosi]|uniref:hypothetical protein n=1 Tax=Bibersteinia trehalosi TaxID=47735 RepID=UPI002D799B16|nr:hypothetical protein [Bibersteinia trehalosi]
MDITAIYASAKSTLDILSGMGTNDILRERITLLREQLDVLRYAQETAEKELTQLKEKCRLQEEELSRYRTAEQFIFEHGAAFKKTSCGYIATPYCPNCLIAVGAEKLLFPFKCCRCGWCSSFKGKHLQDILNSLP